MIRSRGRNYFTLIATLIGCLVLYYNGLGLNRLLQQRADHDSQPQDGTNKRLTMRGDDTDNDTDSITDEKKVCVIFAGPHKTGSTSIERFLKGTTGKPALLKDNYADFGPKARNLADCFCDDDTKAGKGYSKEYCDELLNRFKKFIDRHAGKSNILLAHESFAIGTVDIEELSHYLSPHFKIHVVVHYRRFYDWMHSGYNQIYKEDNHKHTGPMLTFQEWLARNMETYYRDRYSNAVYKRYKNTPSIDNVSIVNMHQHNVNFNTANSSFDGVVSFACDQLDDAPHTCDAAKSRPGETNLNPSVPLDWTVFSGKLKNYHSIVEKMNDEDWQNIEEKFNSMTNLPRVCLSGNLKEKLLRLSLEAETVVMPEWWYNSEKGLVAIQSDFQKKINSKMCDIDVEMIAMSSEWQEFMEGIEFSSRRH